MVAKDYGYTAFENEKNSQSNYNTSYYIEDVINGNVQDKIELTPIQQFYDGTSIFITGSTGFLGKLLVEKLLRSCPTVSTLYLLVRSKKGKNLDERVDEMFDDVIFSRLKKECPKFRHKVIGVAGDCSLPGLGLNVQDRKLLAEEVNVVFHVAATVRFDEKIKTAVAINIRSPRDLVRLGKEMKGLKSFVHVSTVYGNCLNSYIEERIYDPPIDGNKLILMTENVPEKMLDELTPRLLGPYPNSYAYTKQIAEDVVREESENMPVGIFRPAIVVSTYKEPIKSWINNMYGPTGVCAGAGVGLLRTLYCDSNVNANLVPADMCVNSLITSAWEIGEDFKKATKENTHYEVPVYNYESGTDKPITWGKFMYLSEINGIKYPSIKCIWYYQFNLYRYYPIYLLFTFLLHTIPAILTDSILFCTGRKPRLMAAYRKVHKFSNVISYFSTREWHVKSDRVRNQQKVMCENDRELFFSDLKQLDWDEFFQTYLKGVRIYLLQDPLETLETARVKWTWFYYANHLVKILSYAGLTWLSYSCSKLLISFVL
ncbi:fatty acyl-CoA reductase wat-like [Anthonomus grandis grandis]|uniref:fatty acyl-CoA reductase wat-like n=1 Tax=Anthonomus grandis grandis TaxID=2921223 RepID=UPI002166AC33|nr:fatty acyl-CoA reductase wat-like [Anthonomus grandis grandis]